MSINENTNTPSKKMYRPKELAEYLGVSKSTIWRYAQEGKIKSYKLSGGVTVFNIDEVTRDLLESITYEQI